MAAPRRVAWRRRSVPTVLAAALAAAVGAIGPSGASQSHPRIATEDEIDLSASPGRPSLAPAVALTTEGAATRVHVVWEEDGEIVHRSRLLPDGAWSVRTGIYYPGQDPSLAARGEALALSFTRSPFEAGDPTEIYTARWQAGTWQGIRAVTHGGFSLTEGGQQSDLAFGPDLTLWLAWVNTSGGTFTPYYAHLAATGEPLASGSIRASDTNVQAPSVAVEPEGTVWAAWSNAPQAVDEELVYLSSRPPGTSGFDPEPRWLNDESSRGRVPRIAVDRDNLCVTWQETLDPGGANQDVFLECNNEPTQYNHSATANGRSLEPSVAVDDRIGALVLWQERQPSQPAEIAFRSGPPPPERATVRIADGTVRSPSVAYRDGTVHAAWVVGDGADSEVRYARWAYALPTATPTASRTATSDRPSVTPTRTGTPTFATPTPTGSREPTATPGTRTATPTADAPRPTIFLPFGIKPRS